MKTTANRSIREALAQGRPLVRGELERQGMRGNTLSEMCARGEVYRVGRGVYAPADGAFSGLFDYELAAKVAPRGVFTLISALRLHGLTEENPQRMTMAIAQKGHRAKTSLPLDFVYMKPELLGMDVMEMESCGVWLKVFTVERTLAECFKHRNKTGVGVAARALREASSRGLVDFAEFGRVLSRCRMMRVVQPYLEGLS